jgi:hypothetical protein
MAQYDLMPKFLSYIDPHFALPVLRFLRERQIYSREQLLRAEMEMAKKTKFVSPMPLLGPSGAFSGVFPTS